MFNDKSTAAERQAVLQALLRRGAQDAAGSPHTPEELNRLLARCGGLLKHPPACQYYFMTSKPVHACAPALMSIGCRALLCSYVISFLWCVPGHLGQSDCCSDAAERWLTRTRT